MCARPGDCTVKLSLYHAERVNILNVNSVPALQQIALLHDSNGVLLPNHNPCCHTITPVAIP